MEGSNMLRSVMLSALALISAVTLSAGEPTSTDPAHSAIERTVEARSRAWAKAAVDGDVDAFRAFASKDYLLLEIEPKTAEHAARWTTTTREQWADSLRSGQLKYHSVELRNTKVHVNGDVALFTGEYTESGVRNGTEYTDSGLFVETWAKRQGQWIVVSSVFP
jgi:ketosteroid isomerase-like protein